jgi:hypothetical protein
MGLITTALATNGALLLFLFGVILYAVHLLTIIGVGKQKRSFPVIFHCKVVIEFLLGHYILGIEMPDILLASNANIGMNM